MNGGGKSTAVSHGGLAPASSRWTPAKEQINILESLYKQGIRTPTADQIQQITNRLKNYGHIEGKNVFYWFQNHKARQRQRQKQEVAAAYFNNFYHHPSPPRPPPPAPPVLFSPPIGRRLVTIQPSPDFGYHGMNIAPQKIPLPSSVKRRFVDRQMYMNVNNVGGCGRGGGGVTMHHHHQVGGNILNHMNRVNDDNGTLRLFPLEPTGGKVAPAPETVVVLDDEEDEEIEGRRFFDFLSEGKERKLS